jgi:hypothetical protein
VKPQHRLARFGIDRHPATLHTRVVHYFNLAHVFRPLHVTNRKSSGTSPNVYKITASSNSPSSASPCRRQLRTKPEQQSTPFRQFFGQPASGGRPVVNADSNVRRPRPWCSLSVSGQGTPRTSRRRLRRANIRITGPHVDSKLNRFRTFCPLHEVRLACDHTRSISDEHTAGQPSSNLAPVMFSASRSSTRIPRMLVARRKKWLRTHNPIGHGPSAN